MGACIHAYVKPNAESVLKQFEYNGFEYRHLSGIQRVLSGNDQIDSAIWFHAKYSDCKEYTELYFGRLLGICKIAIAAKALIAINIEDSLVDDPLVISLMTPELRKFLVAQTIKKPYWHYATTGEAMLGNYQHSAKLTV